MGLTYTRLKDQPKKLLALTGLTRAEFDDWLVAFTKVGQPNATLTQQGKPRQRHVGGGRKATLQLVEDRLMFILVYQKTYPLQEIMGELFDMNVSKVNDWIHRLWLGLRGALDELQVLPEREAQAVAQAQRRTGQTVILDGTERRRQRPKSPEKQTLHYRDKKKTHTDKNLILAERKTRRVLYLSHTYAGTAHDKKIADHEDIAYLPNTTLYQDTGFQGYQPAVVHVRQPKKKLRGRELTAKQKQIDEDEGRVYEGFTTADASGYFTFTRPGGFVAPNVTATSTDVNGSTSEFSRPVHLLWTVLIYLNGDNDLEDDLRDTLNNLVAAGPSPRANVLVLIDGYTNTEYYTGTALYDVTYGQAVSITTQLGPTLTVPSELNMGEGQTLAQFVNWGRNHYPSRFSMLSIVDHGGGWAPSNDIVPSGGALLKQHAWLAGGSGLSWDFSSGYDYLSSPELRQTMANITNNGARPLDVVFYDVCLMGMVEVAYQIKDYASVFVSSQNIGWSPEGPQGRYVQIIHGITPNMTPTQVGGLIVSSYATTLPPNEHPFTISALDLTQLPLVANAVSQLGIAVSQTLTSPDRADVLHQVYNETQKVDYDGDFYIEPATDGFVDLYDFAIHAAQHFTDTNIILAAHAVTEALTTAVIAEAHRSGSPWSAPNRVWNLDNTHGLSIFLPLGEDLKLPIVITETSPITPNLEVTRNLRLRELYSSRELQFVSDTDWGGLINEYYQVVSVTAVTKNEVPIGGLIEPDVAAPKTTITATGATGLGSVVTLTWAAADVQPGSGVSSGSLWYHPPFGQWTAILTQTSVSGIFSFTLSVPCTTGLAVRASDMAGNVEPVKSGSNTIFVDVPYCRYLPLVFR